MAMEQKPFKLRSQGEDGSNPSFKAMGAVDTPAKHYSTDFGSHRHPHKSGGLNAMEETPNKKMHDSPANAMEGALTVGASSLVMACASANCFFI